MSYALTCTLVPCVTAQVVTDATFEEMVLKSDIPVLVDFWAGPADNACHIIDTSVTLVCCLVGGGSERERYLKALLRGAMVRAVPHDCAAH